MTYSRAHFRYSTTLPKPRPFNINRYVNKYAPITQTSVITRNVETIDFAQVAN